MVKLISDIEINRGEVEQSRIEELVNTQANLDLIAVFLCVCIGTKQDIV